MLVFIDKTGYDRRNTIRKYGYSFRGMTVQDCWSEEFDTLQSMYMSGIHDVCLVEGTVNGDEFADFV